MPYNLESPNARRKKIDLEKVKASLAAPCPQCGYQIPPAVVHLSSSKQIALHSRDRGKYNFELLQPFVINHNNANTNTQSLLAIVERP